MTKPSPPQLSAAAEHEIALLLGIFDNLDQRAAMERKLRRKFQAQAELADTNLEAFNDAFARAVAMGMDDPQTYAETNVKLSHRTSIQAKKAKGIARMFEQANLVLADHDAEKAEAGSRTANQPQRRRLQSDRRYLALLGAEERNANLHPGGSVGLKIRKALPGYRLPHWEKATLPLKAMALSVEVADRGSRTINLRMSQAACRKALNAARGPVSFAQNQVRETLRRRFADDAPAFWFVMEKDSDDLFHLHGAYEDQGHLDHKLVDAALRDAGGWTDISGAGLGQISVRLTDPFWWAAYATKRLNLTAQITDRKLMASTAELRDSARGKWDALRHRLNEL